MPFALSPSGVISFISHSLLATEARYGTVDTHSIGGTISSSISRCPYWSVSVRIKPKSLAKAIFMIESSVKNCDILARSRCGFCAVAVSEESAAYFVRILSTMVAITPSMSASRPGTSLPLYPADVWALILSCSAVSSRLNMESSPGTS